MPKTSSKIAAKLSKVKVQKQEWPVWTGPCGDGDNGGITQGMIGKFICDRERFGLRYLDGWKAVEGFSHRLEYGNMWHLCEELHGQGKDWQTPLEQFAQTLTNKYPTNSEEIGKYYNSCLTQFPVYLDYWDKHPDTEIQEPLEREVTFDIQYQLPSGRTVRLRGKRDGVNRVADGAELQENKAKGQIDERAIRNQLKWDLQTMLYIVGLKQQLHEQGDDTPVVGVLYNVIKRPFSSGKGNIKPRQASKNIPAETPDEFWDRLKEYFVNDPQEWFARWHVKVTDRDCETFTRNCLDPLLETICDWYECQTICVERRKNASSRHERCKKHGNLHFQTPLGIYNPLMDGRETEWDGMLEDGRTLGLTRNTLLFPELQ